MVKRVYLDYAATTPIDPRVLAAMMPYFKEKFGNPSSVHFWGQEARKAIEQAREKAAQALGCKTNEIFFTSTTTTSDNLAIQGVMKAARELKKGEHLITSSIEHHAVLDTCQALKKEGFKLTILPVDKYGLVNPQAVRKMITSGTALISIMYANNEVGTIEPVVKIGEMIRQLNAKRYALKANRIYFHTDAATAVDYLEINVQKLGIDLMTIGAHKFGGPKGVGLLYIRKGTPIEPITFGGHHEKGFWPGTEAVPLIVGMAKALEIAVTERKESTVRVSQLRDRLIKGVLTQVPNSHLTGHPSKRLPDIASFVIEGVEGEAMLLMLSDQGIAASSGSACTSGILKPSHVLTAMGIPAESAHGSLRFSLGKKTTEEEIDYVLRVLPKVVSRLRKMAPNL